MRVKLATLMAGPDVVHQVGAIIDVTPAEAKYLVETHHATYVDKEKPAAQAETPPEVEPEGKKKKGKGAK